MIPEYIIDWFKERFKVYPSIVEVNHKPEQFVNELTSKSHLLQYQKIVSDKITFNVKRLFEYDPTGILLYVEETDEKNYFNIFVLSLVDKQQIIDYVLHNLNKKFKNYGNK
jgi:hypothetical protein